jgi:AcrR family transcriptional regulator
MSSLSIGRVSRWEPNARERLERAALDLFVEVGFAEATVPQITARAGLTTRTFFRHFADKREVLFAVEQELPALVARLMSEAPASLTPMMLVERGLQTVAVTRFEGNLDYLRSRRAVVQADEGLRERELRKFSVLADAIRREFRNRGADELTATLTAQVAVTVLGVSVDRWLDQGGTQPLTELVHDTLGALRAVISDHDGRTPSLPGDADER